MSELVHRSGGFVDTQRGERALPAWRGLLASWLRSALRWVTGESAESERERTIAAPAFSDGLLELLDAARQTAALRVQHVNGMTTRETLAAGEALDAVVQEAQAQITGTRTALSYAAGGEGGAGMAALLARQSEAMSRYLDTLSHLLAGQDTAARDSEKACARIAELGAAIEDVAAQTRFLSLNARIEAARLGERGTAMHVIAAEMEHLNQEVAAANRAIAELVASLLAQLPAISRSAGDLREASGKFSEALAHGLAEVRAGGAAFESLVQETLSDANSRIERIVGQSHAALSHLQFQDACAQHLLSIDAVLGRVRERVEQAIEAQDGELLTAVSFEETYSNPDRWAGEVSALRGGEDGEDGATTPGDVMLL